MQQLAVEKEKVVELVFIDLYEMESSTDLSLQSVNIYVVIDQTSACQNLYCHRPNFSLSKFML